MRDAIARALEWALRLLLPARGRHAADPAQTSEPAPLVLCAPCTPIPPHVLARSIPCPWGHRIGPWVLAREEPRPLSRQQADDTLELRIKHGRRRALYYATQGVDLPYTYPGAPFPASAFRTVAGVSA